MHGATIKIKSVSSNFKRPVVQYIKIGWCEHFHVIITGFNEAVLKSDYI